MKRCVCAVLVFVLITAVLFSILSGTTNVLNPENSLLDRARP